MSNEHWKFVWPSAPALANFLALNRQIFENSTIVELGAGCTGLVGLSALKLGAKKVILTEYSGHLEALNILNQNVSRIKDSLSSGQEVEVVGLDWLTSLEPHYNDPGNIKEFLSTLEDCDFILASDVFYEPSLYRSLMRTLAMFIEKFPRLKIYFSYHLRDENHSIEHLLYIENLECHLIRTVEEAGTIQIGVIYRKLDSSMSIHGGIEGGATHSKLVLFHRDGKRSEDIPGPGTNMLLNGLEITADSIASWVRTASSEHSISLPLETLGLGLSGAEDDLLNEKFVQYLTENHGDIAKHFSLCSDSIGTIQAAFDKEGVVIIAGTGSSVRMLREDGSAHGVGGWGHMIGDGGSGFWIAQRAIRVIFDHEDGLEESAEDITLLKKCFFEYFKLQDKVGILDHLYSNFEKPKVAAFTSVLAKNSHDPAIQKIFYDAGFILGKQLASLSHKMSEKMKSCCDIVTVGSVFGSWSILKPGFVDAVKISDIKKIRLFTCDEGVSIGAGLLAIKKAGETVEFERKTTVYEELYFDKN